VKIWCGMWREVWTVLFVICLILSGTTSNVAATAQTMQIFHTFNVTLGENGLNIEVTPGSLIDFNVTNLNTSYAIGDLNATVLNASDIEVLMETFNNDTLAEIEENMLNAIASDRYVQAGLRNLMIENDTYSSFTLQYFLANNESRVVVVTVGILNNDTSYYSHLMTFLYYSSIHVNVSYWFGDTIIFNFTHSLAEHYVYIAQVLQYAVNNIYRVNSTLEAQYLTAAYETLAQICYDIHNLIKTTYNEYNLPIKEATILAIDPLTTGEIFAFIIGLLILVFYSLPMSYAIASEALGIAAQAWFLWKLDVITLASTWQDYTQGRASILDVVWAIAALIWDIVNYVIGRLKWWKALAVKISFFSQYSAGGIAAWITLIAGAAFLLAKLVIDWID